MINTLHQSPVLSTEIIEWLNEERYLNETDTQLLNQKLAKLMKLERQGF